MSSVEPTPPMVAFYEQRTQEHIARVAHCLRLLADVTTHAEQLHERARAHDVSKWSSDERGPYTWLTEFHRCRRLGLPFTYPEGMEEKVREAIQHHLHSNRHHPEFHDDPNHMTEVDLMEMVCDWTAMAQEFGECGGSARGWADRTVGVRVRFDGPRRDFVYKTIELLDSRLLADQG